MKELGRIALVLFISALLSFSFCQGLGSKAANLIRNSHNLQPNDPPLHDDQGILKMRREMSEMETDDYDGPKPNVNTRGGAVPSTPIPPGPGPPPPSR